MITLRKGADRHHDRRLEQEAWLTFGPLEREGAPAVGLGSVEMLYEDRLPPGAGVLRSAPRDVEVITHVREGTLTYEDSTGRSGLILAGEFHRMTTAPGVLHGATNASRSDWAHVFRLTLRPLEDGRQPSHEQKRFSIADRRGGLCAVASHDARQGSLRIHQDAVLYSAILDRGQHVVHELAEGRRAWLQLLQGELTLGDLSLSAGDGVVVTAERAVSATARRESEFLLLDLR